MKALFRENAGEALVGLLVVVAAIWFVLFAWHATGGGAKAGGVGVTALFPSAGGVNVGTDVKIAGLKVGTVTGLTLDPKSYQVAVKLKFNPGVRLPSDSSAQVATEGLLGGTYIGLTPGGAETMLKSGDTITDTQGSMDLMALIGQFINKPASDAGAGAAAKPTDGSAPGRAGCSASSRSPGSAGRLWRRSRRKAQGTAATLSPDLQQGNEAAPAPEASPAAKAPPPPPLATSGHADGRARGGDRRAQQARRRVARSGDAAGRDEARRPPRGAAACLRDHRRLGGRATDRRVRPGLSAPAAGRLEPDLLRLALQGEPVAQHGRKRLLGRLAQGLHDAPRRNRTGYGGGRRGCLVGRAIQREEIGRRERWRRRAVPAACRHDSPSALSNSAT